MLLALEPYNNREDPDNAHPPGHTEVYSQNSHPGTLPRGLSLPPSTGTSHPQKLPQVAATSPTEIEHYLNSSVSDITAAGSG